MYVSTLASETVAISTPTPPLSPLSAALLRHNEPTPLLPRGSLPPLPLVPKWSQLLHLSIEWAPGGPRWQGWQLELADTPFQRRGVRELYTTLANLPRLDQVGRFAHIDFSMPGLSTGPELLRLAPDPPREEYPRAQQLTPGWSVWYKPSRVRWAVGIVTGTRFLIAQHAGTVVDPFTSEARWAFFLP
jgi:hypothetical protein